MSLRGALANIRGRHDVRHIPGSGDQAVRLTSAVWFRPKATGNSSFDLARVPVSAGDAAPPWRNLVTPRKDAAGSLTPPSGARDPAALRRQGRGRSSSTDRRASPA